MGPRFVVGHTLGTHSLHAITHEPVPSRESFSKAAGGGALPLSCSIQNT